MLATVKQVCKRALRPMSVACTFTRMRRIAGSACTSEVLRGDEMAAVVVPEAAVGKGRSAFKVDNTPPESVAKGLIEQMNTELFNEQAYLQASIFFRRANFDGLASWARAEAADEHKHALLFMDYLIDRGVDDAALLLPSTTAERVEGLIEGWKKPIDVFNSAAQAELDTTKNIEKLASLAREEGDEQTAAFLQPFLRHQVMETEEKDSARKQALAYARMPGLLYHLDSEMKNGAFFPSSDSTGVLRGTMGGK